MINEITIKNFKSIKCLDLKLSPLTIFVGPNGSGKTSILESVALMKQSVRRLTEYRDLVESLKGELVDFESIRSLLFKEEEEELLSLGLAADLTSVEWESIRKSFVIDAKTYRPAPGTANKVAMKTYKRIRATLWRFYRALRIAQHIRYLHSIKADRTHFKHRYSTDKISVEYEMTRGRRVGARADRRIGIGEPNPQAFLPPFTVMDHETVFLKSITDSLRQRLKNIYYISAERGVVPWTYEPKGAESTWVGRRGEHTLEILSKLMKPQFDKKRLPYELFFSRFGIKHAWAGWERQKVLTSNYTDPFLESSHKFPLLGYGSKQIIPIITQLAYSEEGSVILVEEPEMSLHPSFQRSLPALFGRAIKEGKQVLVTTHSSYFPLSLDLVFKGFTLQGQTTRGRRRYKIKLSVDDVIVYHVGRNKKGYTEVERLEIDENGLKEGIPSFIDVERRILERFIDKE